MEIQVNLIKNNVQLAIKAHKGALLSDILAAEGASVDLPCAGKGRCGKCRVVATGDLSAPAEAETRLLSSAELASGVRLSCQTRVMGEACVELTTDTVYDNILTVGEMPSFEPNPLYVCWGMAVDIGTTTISAQLYNAQGFVGAVSMKNPQVAFGADVISRVERALTGDKAILAWTVRRALATLSACLADNAGIAPEQIDTYVVTGNTAMLYLLTEQNPKELSRAPFDADRLFGETLLAAQLGLPGAGTVYLPRCVSAFVGADITTAVLATGMLQSEATTLLCDIGTNGEIALWHQGALYCCSTAAGPAFEGAGISMGSYGVRGAVDKVWVREGRLCCSTIGDMPAVGICGSGIVDALSAMLTLGILEETGALADEEDFVALGNGVGLTAQDVRKIQLAKGSVRAGMETLLDTVGVDKAQVACLYIAGGFGSYLNLSNAAKIGLIPPKLLPVTKVIGNAAQTGAAMLLRARPFIQAAETLAQNARTIELSGSHLFMEHYMNHMLFGE